MAVLLLLAHAHISSNWTSRVRGGKSHELVMSVAGMSSGHLRQAGDGVSVDVHQASGPSEDVALGEVLEHGAGLLVGQVGLEQGRALALGEAVLAGFAVVQADVIVVAVGCADGEVPCVAAAVERANRLLATEPSEVVDGMRSSRRPERVGLRGRERDASDVTAPVPRLAFRSSEPPPGFVLRHMCPRA